MTRLPSDGTSRAIIQATGVPMPSHNMGAAQSHQRPQAAPAGAGISGKDVCKILRKRWLMILVSLMIFVGLSVGITFVWMKYAPSYTASAWVVINQSKRDVLGTARDGSSQMLEIEKKSLAQLAKRRSVLSHALERDVDNKGQVRKPGRIKSTSYYRQNRLDIIQELQNDLSVGSTLGTNYVTVSFSGVNSGELPGIANAVADALVAEATERDSLMKNRELDNIRKQLQSVTVLLKSQQDGVRRERESSEDDELFGTQGMIQQTLKDLETQRTAYASQIALFAPKYDEALKRAKDGTYGSMDEIRQVILEDERVRRLEQELDSLAMMQSTMSQNFGKDHRSVKDARTRVAAVKSQLDSIKQRVAREGIETFLATYSTNLEGLKQSYEELKKKYEEKLIEARKQERAALTIRRAETQIRDLTVRKKELDGAAMRIRLDIGQPRFSIASPAEIPDKRSSPKWTINIPVGVLLGLVVGVGFAFILELVDTSIKGPADIARRVDMPLLGVVPHEDDIEEELEDMRSALLTMPDSLVAESFRHIRTGLLYSGPVETRRSLIVTSPSAADGRTTIAVNLAASLSHSGLKVLLVDANFRQPMLHRIFEGTALDGLSSALVGRSDWKDKVNHVTENLHVMAAGPLPPSPAELLGSAEMKKLLSQMVDEYDQVIFDGPPALVVSDAAVMSTIVDGVILTVRAGASTFGIVQRTRGIFSRVGAHMVGAVLNGIRVSTGGYLQERYNEFYDYQEHDEEDEEYSSVLIPGGVDSIVDEQSEQDNEEA